MLNFLEKMKKGSYFFISIIIETQLKHLHFFSSFICKTFVKSYDSEKIRKLVEKSVKDDKELQKAIVEADKYQAKLKLNRIKTDIKIESTASANLNKSDSSLVKKHFKIKIETKENGEKLNKTLNDVSNLN